MARRRRWGGKQEEKGKSEEGEQGQTVLTSALCSPAPNVCCVLAWAPGLDSLASRLRTRSRGCSVTSSLVSRAASVPAAWWQSGPFSLFLVPVVGRIRGARAEHPLLPGEHLPAGCRGASSRCSSVTPSSPALFCGCSPASYSSSASFSLLISILLIEHLMGAKR